MRIKGLVVLVLLQSKCRGEESVVLAPLCAADDNGGAAVDILIAEEAVFFPRMNNGLARRLGAGAGRGGAPLIWPRG